MTPLEKLLKGKEEVEPNTKVVVEHFDVKDLVERIASTHLVDHNRIRNATSKSDLSEIKEQIKEPEIAIRDCI